MLRYIKCSLKQGVLYGGGVRSFDQVIVGYTNSSFARCLNTRNSLLGYLFTIFGSVVSWKCCLQHVVTLSTTEAKFIIATEVVKEGMWLQGLMKEFVFFFKR